MNDTEPADSHSPRVFISYSHDNREHCDRVLALAQQLRRDGIDVELDQFHQHELLHWPRWCEEHLRPEKSDFVLCVCTAEYKRRIEGKVVADVGKGVFWEGTLIYNYLYDNKGNSRCVPVYLADADAREIPAILKGYPRFHLDKFALDDAGSDYANLYRLFSTQPSAEKVNIGEMRRLPPLPEGKRQTDFGEVVEQILKGIGEVKADIGEVKADARQILSLLKGKPPESTPARPHNLPPWMTPEIFVGRGKELKTLADRSATQSSSAVIQPQVVIGDGGFGKTRLAIQVLWLLYLQDKCDMAFYVSASSPNELDTQLAGLSEESLLNLYADAEPPHELNARRQDVIHALREKVGRWVILLDGADSQEARVATTRLLTELAGGGFIITSRRDDWPKGTTTPVRLELFTPEEACECLRSRYWKKEPSAKELADFDRLAQELGRLPLALALAASYMESRRIGPARYLEEWKQKHDALLKFSGADLDTERSLLATFQLSYDRLDAPAAALLRLIAWLAPEAFPRSLLEGSQRVKEILSANQKPSEKYEVSEALAQLRTLSLIRLDEESFLCHTLVLDCVRALLSEKSRRESLATTLDWLSDSLPKAEYNEAAWNLWSRLGPHLDVIVETGEQCNVKNHALSLLCNWYGSWLYYQARYDMAERLMRRALAIDEKIFAADDPHVSRDLNPLAVLLQDTNRLAEAERLMRRALAIDEKIFAADDPHVSRDLNNLGQLLKAMNRLAEAEPLLRRALAIDEKSLRADHLDVATCLINLATLLQDTNRLAEAEPLLRRALAIYEKSLRADHPDVATCLINLATLLQDTNRLAEAERLMRRALAILFKFTRTTGHIHPNLHHFVGHYYRLLEQMSANAEFEQQLVELMKGAGFDAQASQDFVSRCLINLAESLKATNRLAEAEPLMRRALAILFKFTRTTGHIHPNLHHFVGHYYRLLEQMSANAEFEQQLVELMKGAGFDAQASQDFVSRLFHFKS